MKRRYDLGLFYDIFINTLDQLELETDFPSVFYEAFNKGQHQISQHKYQESKQFDQSWIQTITSYFSSIDKITKNLKSNLTYQEDITIIEKAKKIDSRSVRHLAANTHLIKEVKPNVVPKKILVNYSEIEYGIYENRFIMTLINRLEQFVYQRLKIIKESLYASQKTHLNYQSNFQVEKEDFNIKVEITQQEKIKNKQTDAINEDILRKADYLYKQIIGLKNSQFMNLLKGHKEVTAPIMKTQIILKNPDYKNAYKLWLYLDQYTSLGYELLTENTQKKITKSYQKHLTQNTLLLFSTLIFHDKAYKDETLYQNKKKRKFKSNIKRITSLDLPESQESFKIEGQELNEYFINEMKNIFHDKVQTYQEEEFTYQTSIKKAITDTLNITNALIESYLEINADADAFPNLSQADQSIQALEIAERKYRLSKMIRNIKQKEYEKALKLETKWQTQIILKQKQISQEEKKKLTALEQLKNKEQLEKQKQNIKKQDEQLKKQLAAAKAKHKETLKKIKEKHKEKLKKQKQRAIIKQKEHKEKQALKLKKTKQAYKEKETKLKDELNDKNNR